MEPLCFSQYVIPFQHDLLDVDIVNYLPFSAMYDVLGGASCLTGFDGCLDIVIILILPLRNLVSCCCFTTSFAGSGEDKLGYETE